MASMPFQTPALPIWEVVNSFKRGTVRRSINFHQLTAQHDSQIIQNLLQFKFLAVATLKQAFAVNLEERRDMLLLTPTKESQLAFSSS